MVEKYYDGLLKFESSLHLMKWAESSLRQMGLEPIDDVLPTVSLLSWSNTVRRITFLVLKQKDMPR